MITTWNVIIDNTLYLIAHVKHKTESVQWPLYSGKVPDRIHWTSFKTRQVKWMMEFAIYILFNGGVRFCRQNLSTVSMSFFHPAFIWIYHTIIDVRIFEHFINSTLPYIKKSYRKACNKDK